jgi:H-NS histone C-terminal domain
MSGEATMKTRFAFAAAPPSPAMNSRRHRNPKDPSQTWAGRGLQPIWMSDALKSGKKIESLRAEAHAKAARTTHVEVDLAKPKLRLPGGHANARRAAVYQVLAHLFIYCLGAVGACAFGD